MRCAVRRRRGLNVLRCTAAGLWIGCAAALLPLGFGTAFRAAVPFLAGIAGLVAGVFLSVSRLETARRIDRFFRLKDRVATAWEILRAGNPSPAAEAQLRDTSEQLRAAVPDPRQGARRLFPVPRFWVFAVLAGCGLACAVPHLLPAENTLLHRFGTGSEREENIPENWQTRVETLLDELKETAFRKTPYTGTDAVKELQHRTEELPHTVSGSAEEADALLEKWQKAFSDAARQLASESNSSEFGEVQMSGGESENGEPSSSASETDQNAKKTLETSFREQVGKIIACRADIPLGAMRSGEDGTEHSGRSDSTWGIGTSDAVSGEPEALPDAEFEDVLLPSTPSGTPADSSAEGNDANLPVPEAEAVTRTPPVSAGIPEKPVHREMIPERDREMVKKYFTYP